MFFLTPKLRIGNHSSANYLTLLGCIAWLQRTILGSPGELWQLMKGRDWNLLGAALLLALAFGPLVFWGSRSRFEYQIETEARRRMFSPAAVPISAAEDIAKALPILAFPVAGAGPRDVISFFGDPRSGGARAHKGIDIRAGRGAPVLAVADAEVLRTADKGNGGRQIWLRLAGGVKVYYAHLHEIHVEKGDWVSRGQVLGTVGNTGNARHTIPHLHFELINARGKEENPLPIWGKL